ncbi:MAG: rod shape-determining protein MreC [Cytophagaceae bacterium]|jgi:rod shape-determining protein MreC|nr:rod shape-determining protein MreC [Cytophagaceae bacterium]
MIRLLQFFYQYRDVSLFFLLQFICFWLIVSLNVYQTSSYFNSSHYVAGKINQAQSNVVDYFRLSSINQQLAEENQKLRQLLTIQQQKQVLMQEAKLDSSHLSQYKYTTAKVINNSINKFSSNYFTIDKGSNHGIKPGTGVLSVGGGVAGRVKSCTGNFSLVSSLLNENSRFPIKIKRGNIDGILEWEGPDPTEASILYIGKHHKVYVGDTVITSGYNTMFPEGMIVGKIKNVVDDGKKYLIQARLATDFTAMSYVYLVEDQLKGERDSLENKANKGKITD